MKVICITHDYHGPWSSFSVEKFVKIGDLYDVIENFDEMGNYYQLTLSNGELVNLSKNYFKTVSKLREEKLKKILEDE